MCAIYAITNSTSYPSVATKTHPHPSSQPSPPTSISSHAR